MASNMSLERIYSRLDPDLYLSPRGIEVVKGLSNGIRAREMAGILGTATDTIYEHLEGLRRHLGAKTNAELVRIAIDHGFIRSMKSDVL
jgi:DNA-binding CsgD family transcriptional regulator